MNNEEVKDEQIIEVEYDKEMVEADLKAQEENDLVMLEQDTFNEDPIDKLLGEGAEIDEYTEIE